VVHDWCLGWVGVIFYVKSLVGCVMAFWHVIRHILLDVYIYNFIGRCILDG
jgi:hypothetical protein